ncbi:putative cysteine desulfurase [Alphaproteobacteria bacterium]|nr:putative cysteine desulfurase [Alphaproteobacteria bacterium]
MSKRDGTKDFAYLPDGAVYLDCACQSLRPQPVIDALNEYYTQFNSCGERVKYAWGRRVDERVEGTREALLKYLKLSPRTHFVSFTLNTSYGLNLILDQIRPEIVKKVMTSDIEHNSPFLSTITFSRRHNIPREVIVRNNDGTISLGDYDFDGALVVVNTVSNIDGRRLENVNELIGAVHQAGGFVVIDAAQGMSFGRDLLLGSNADAICFSSHKMYGPSLGGIIMKKSFAEQIDTTFIGGGMVDDVTGTDSYVLSAESDNHIYTKFEAGLQAWGEIVALGAAVKWLDDAHDDARLVGYGQRIIDALADSEKFVVVNEKASPTICIFHRDIDAHLLAEALSDQGIMARSGYFCCHYYLDKVKEYPPLLRLSIGLHNTDADIDKLIKELGKVA